MEKEFFFFFFLFCTLGEKYFLLRCEGSQYNYRELNNYTHCTKLKISKYSSILLGGEEKLTRVKFVI